MKKVLAVILVLAIVTTSLVACESKQSIVGVWYFDDQGTNHYDMDGFYYLEFFDDGTYTSNRSNYHGSYSMSGDRLKLEGRLVSDEVYTIALKDDSLQFFYNNGKLWGVFTRQ